MYEGVQVALNVVLVQPAPELVVALPLALGVDRVDVLGLGQAFTTVLDVLVSEDNTKFGVSHLLSGSIVTAVELFRSKGDIDVSLSSREQRRSETDEGTKCELHLDLGEEGDLRGNGVIGEQALG